MKRSLTLLLVTIRMVSFAQTPARDSIRCLPYWKKGETRVYSIAHATETSSPDKPLSKFSFVYDVHVTVLDSTASGYTMQWVFQIPEEFKRKNPRLVDSMTVYNGLTMVYTIDATGAFTSLTNWQEVLAAYIKMFEQTLPKDLDSTQKALLLQSKAMFNSKEAVEGTMIKEIRLFHVPYGHVFSTEATLTNTQLPNVIGNDPIPAIQTYRYLPPAPPEDLCRLVMDQDMDKAALPKMIEGMFKKMNISDDKVKEEVKKAFTSMEMKDHSEYYYIAATGWLQLAGFTRTLRSRPVNKTETYVIKLK